MARPIDPRRLDEAVAMCRQGASTREASRASGISHTTVGAACKLRGVKPSGSPVSRPTAEQVEQRVEAIDRRSAEFQRAETGAGLEAAAEFAGVETPSVLPPEQAAIILRCAAKGMGLRTAAKRAGVPGVRVTEWEQRAEEGAEPWASWMLLVGQAEGAGVEECHNIIRSGRPGWQSAGWLLEHTRPREYGKRIELAAEVAASPLAELPIETLYDVADAFRAKSGGGE